MSSNVRVASFVFSYKSSKPVSQYWSDPRHNVTCCQCGKRYSARAVPESVQNQFLENTKIAEHRPRPVRFGLCPEHFEGIQRALNKTKADYEKFVSAYGEPASIDDPLLANVGLDLERRFFATRNNWVQHFWYQESQS